MSPRSPNPLPNRSSRQRASIARTLALTVFVVGIDSRLSPALVAGTVHVHPDPLTVVPTPADFAKYEQLAASYENHPLAFVHDHPFVGRLLTHPALAEKWTDEWEANETRFEHLHPFRWSILEKYLLIREAMNLAPSLTPATSPLASPNPSDPPRTPSPFADPPPSVDEPPTILLALSALVPVLVFFGVRRRKPSPLTYDPHSSGPE